MTLFSVTVDRLPHVRAHEVQRRAAGGAEPVEEALQCGGLAFASELQCAVTRRHSSAGANLCQEEPIYSAGGRPPAGSKPDAAERPVAGLRGPSSPSPLRGVEAVSVDERNRFAERPHDPGRIGHRPNQGRRRPPWNPKPARLPGGKLLSRSSVHGRSSIRSSWRPTRSADKTVLERCRSGLPDAGHGRVARAVGVVVRDVQLESPGSRRGSRSWRRSRPRLTRTWPILPAVGPRGRSAPAGPRPRSTYTAGVVFDTGPFNFTAEALLGQGRATRSPPRSLATRGTLDPSFRGVHAAFAGG